MTTERAVLDALEAFLAAHGYAPTLRELAAVCGVSHVRVRVYLRRLERAGLVHRDYATARSLTVTRGPRGG